MVLNSRVTNWRSDVLLRPEVIFFCKTKQKLGRSLQTSLGIREPSGRCVIQPGWSEGNGNWSCQLEFCTICLLLGNLNSTLQNRFPPVYPWESQRGQSLLWPWKQMASWRGAHSRLHWVSCRLIFEAVGNWELACQSRTVNHPHWGSCEPRWSRGWARATAGQQMWSVLFV